jgi:hypothetical protein
LGSVATGRHGADIADQRLAASIFAVITRSRDRGSHSFSKSTGMDGLPLGLSSIAVEPVHLVDAVRPVVHAHRRHAVVVFSTVRTTA